MSFRIIFEFILNRFIMLPFKQIKSSLSHQNLPQRIPPMYPSMMTSQSQLQIRRERINAVPQYDMQPKSTENFPQFRDIYSHQSSNGGPLTFNVNPNYKNKIKKATRPISRTGNKTLQGPPSQRNQVQDFRPQQRGYTREKLEDFSRTTSTLFNNFSFQASEQYQNVKTQNTPEKIYTVARNRQENVKEWTPNYEKIIRPQTAQTQVITKSSPRINFIQPVSTQPFVQNLQKRGQEANLLQDIKYQQETIENFQRQVISLNSEIRELKNSNQHLLRQYDEIAKQIRNRQQKKIDENLYEWQREQYSKKLAEIEKMEKQLTGKNSLNLYLQQQCNFYNDNYKKQVAESKRLKDEFEKQKQKLNSTIGQLKKQLEERQKNKQDQTSIKQLQSLLSKRDSEIENIKKIIDMQLAKIEKQQHDIEVDRSEINMLLMKLESLQSKNQQLTVQLQQNAKKYQQDLFKEKQSKIEQLMKCNQQVSDKSCELINMEQKWKQAQYQCSQIEAEYKQIQKKKISLEKEINNLKAQFENKINLYEKEYKVSQQTCQVKEQLIVQYCSKIDSFYQKQKMKEEKLEQMQTKYEKISQQNQKLQEDKSQLVMKLRQVMQHFDRDEHAQCRMSIQLAKEQLKSIKSQKQQIFLQLKKLQEQKKSVEDKFFQSSKFIEEIQSKFRSLSQENTELKNSLDSYTHLQLENSSLIENMSKLKQIQEENRRLTETSERYEVVVLQNCLLSEKLQSYKEIQHENSKLTEKLQKICQLQLTNNQLQKQIKQLEVKLQNQNIELSITKNQLSMHKSTNKQNMQKMQELQKRDQKISELITQIEQQKQNNLLLVRENQNFVLNIKSLEQERQQSVQNHHIKQEEYQSQIQKYIKLLEQKDLKYETQILKQKKCTQLLEQQLLTINAKLQQLQKNQIQNQSVGEIRENKGAARSSKSLSLSPKKVNSQNETSFVDYVQVDKEGLLYICELLNIEFLEGGIINRIIQQLQKELKGWQMSKNYAQFYTQLLELFGIQQKQDNNELLLTEIQGIKENLSFLIEKISQQELKTNEANKNIDFLGKQLLKNKLKVDQLKNFNHQLVILNNELNQQIIVTYAKLCNQKMQTKMVLNIIEDTIEDDPSNIQKEISIQKSEPFFSVKSFKAVDEGNNNETLE